MRPRFGKFIVNMVSAMFAAVLLSALAGTPSCTPSGKDAGSSYSGAKRVAIADIRFDDGDSFYYRGDPIRVLGIDTPETKSPTVGIMENQPFGLEASESTATWMSEAIQIELVFDGRGKYGRQLVHVFVDGELLAVKLLEAGLAYENVTHFGDNGFPDLSDRIVDAAARGPKPQFEQPYKWRQKNQRR
jgi:endonuclease YncB( thermonuclease family)